MTAAATLAPARDTSEPAQRARNVVVIASGKGGVGKTWFAITLAHTWARQGRRVLLVDGDLGLANVDVQLGANPAVDLASVVTGKLDLRRAVNRLPLGFDLAAGSSGSGTLATLPAERVVALRTGVVTLAASYDVVVLDLAAGIDRQVRLLAEAGGTVAVVATPEPTSLTDAYAFIKVAARSDPAHQPLVVVNMAKSESEGVRTAETLRRVCQTYLGFAPQLAGIVRHDAHVAEAIRGQVPILNRFPTSKAAEDVAKVAERLAQRL